MSEVLTRALEMVGETKARRVRTPAGAEHFGQPIGSIIVPDVLPSVPVSKVPNVARTGRIAKEVGEDTRLAVESGTRRKRNAGMTRVESEYQGWKKWETPKGKHYYIGRENDEWVATNAKDEIEVQGFPSEGETMRALLERLDLPVQAKSELMDDMRPVTLEEAREFVKKFGTTIAPGLGDIHIAKDENTKSRQIAAGIQMDGTWRYIYSKQANEEAAEQKWARIAAMQEVIEDLDVALDTASDDDDIAAVVKVMRTTGMRVGSSAEQRGEHPTFGASTLQARHVKVTPAGTVIFDFKGKDNVQQHLVVQGDEKLAAMMTAHKEGKRGTDQLFPDATANSTIEFIRDATGQELKNHDLRTYLANVIARDLLVSTYSKRKRPKNKTEFNRMKRHVGDVVSAQLGNSRTQALNNYVNPAVFLDYDQGGWM